MMAFLVSGEDEMWKWFLRDYKQLNLKIELYFYFLNLIKFHREIEDEFLRFFISLLSLIFLFIKWVDEGKDNDEDDDDFEL